MNLKYRAKQTHKEKSGGAQSRETSWLGESRHKSPGERSTMQLIQMGRSRRKSPELPLSLSGSRGSKTKSTEKT